MGSWWDFYPRIFEDDTIISEDSRRSPKTSEDVRRQPKAKLSSPSLRTRINVSSLPVLFTSKIRDREELLSFNHFTHGFRSLHGSELTYFWKLCQARRQQLTFFNQAWEIGPQAWAGVRSKFSTRVSRLTRESWQVNKSVCSGLWYVPNLFQKQLTKVWSVLSKYTLPKQTAETSS